MPGRLRNARSRWVAVHKKESGQGFVGTANIRSFSLIFVSLSFIFFTPGHDLPASQPGSSREAEEYQLPHRFPIQLEDNRLWLAPPPWPEHLSD